MSSDPDNDQIETVSDVESVSAKVSPGKESELPQFEKGLADKIV